jgi:hypothetical protein
VVGAGVGAEVVRVAVVGVVEGEGEVVVMEPI